MNILPYQNDESKGRSGALGADSEAVQSRMSRSRSKVSKGSKSRSGGSKMGELGLGGVPSDVQGDASACSGAKRSDAAGGTSRRVGGNRPKNDPLGKNIGDLQPFASGAGLEPIASYLESVGESDAKSLLARLNRYERRAVWRVYSNLRAVKCCGYPKLAGKVVVVDNGGVRHYRGVERCKSSWVCLVCAAVIRHERSKEIKRAVLYAMDELGWSVYMVTRTMQHNEGDSLKDLIKLQAECKRWVDNQKSVKNFYKAHGYQGGILAKEVTESDDNGWHPHTHELMFFEKPLTDDDEIELQRLLFVFTNRFYARYGRKKVSADRGIHVEKVRKGDGANVAAEYLAKLDGGFNADMELTRNDLKKGRFGHRSAFQVIEDFCRYEGARYALVKNYEVVPDDLQQLRDRDLAKVHEYEAATFGMHVLHWKQGLRAKLLPEMPEETDDELLERVVSGFDEVEFENWYFKKIVRRKLEGKVLAILQVGGVDALLEQLYEWGLYDEDGFEVLDKEEQEPKTAFDVKCEKELRIYGEALIQAKDRKDASDAMYLNYIRSGHWTYALDDSPFG